ncbi:hypothetical protein [Pedosphaera parvula]|uniref:Uncharacterized protein n=1 Tax=Pedosphaera parvula (strain Ellin514) TaxID=320771 RepID=B9XEF7_PEDPL|nr:hypothetical protein [Pedosphaera parvula]EEF61671.1 conserved hypothetical protein [Pedosphaera parvula Ellin514]
MLTIEPGNLVESGPCECCGGQNRMLSGFVYRDGFAYAAYRAHWTIGRVGIHGAGFYVFLGDWGEESTAEQRVAVSVSFAIHEGKPGFMVVDPGQIAIAPNPEIGKGLKRSEVIGTPMANEVFEVLDAIWLQDERIAEVRNSSG